MLDISADLSLHVVTHLKEANLDFLNGGPMFKGMRAETIKPLRLDSELFKCYIYCIPLVKGS